MARNRIARMSTTGLIDATYNPNFNSTVSAIAMLPDGGSIVGGAFTTGGANIIVSRLARVTSTGLIDTTFTGNVNSNPLAIKVLPNDKIIIGGGFTLVN